MATSDDEALRRLHAQLTSISAGECEEALADALDDVRARAVPIVRAMLIERLLEQLEIRNDLASGADGSQALIADGDVPTPTEPFTGAQGDLIYAYGITAPDAGSQRTRVPGVGGSMASLTPHGGVAIITSLVAAEEFGDGVIDDRLEDAEWVERNVLAHDAVLRSYAGTATVIPFRFGTIYRSEARLRDALDEAQHVLLGALQGVAGAGEWIVSAALPHEVPQVPPTEEPRAGDGLAYLQARRVDRDRTRGLDEWSIQCGQACHERLSEEASASSMLALSPWNQANDPSDERRVLRCAYLVHDTRLSGFVNAADELRSRFVEAGLTIRVEGPLPVYHFVPADVQEAMRG